MKDFTIITNAKIYTEYGIIQNGSVVLLDSKIYEIYDNCDVFKYNNAHIIDVDGKSVIPGFIDLQVNGAGGYLVADSNQQHLKKIGQTLAACGTTSYLAALSPCSEEDRKDAFNNIYTHKLSAKKESKILGIHMEGPFLNPNKAGANDTRCLSLPNETLFSSIADDKELLKMMTISPEIGDFSKIISKAKKYGVVLAIGHSTATYSQAKKHIEDGLKIGTHIFNSMNGINAREPGIVMALSEDDNAFASFICDGNHVHPSVLKLIPFMFGYERLMLVTDSAPTSGTQKKKWVFDGMDIIVKDYTCYLPDGTICGSSLTMNKAAMFAKRILKCTTNDVINMGATNPAKVLGIYNKKGGISVGKDADLIILKDEDTMDPKWVFVEGEVCYGPKKNNI